MLFIPPTLVLELKQEVASHFCPQNMWVKGGGELSWVSRQPHPLPLSPQWWGWDGKGWGQLSWPKHSLGQAGFLPLGPVGPTPSWALCASRTPMGWHRGHYAKPLAPRWGPQPCPQVTGHVLFSTETHVKQCCKEMMFAQEQPRWGLLPETCALETQEAPHPLPQQGTSIRPSFHYHCYLAPVLHADVTCDIISGWKKSNKLLVTPNVLGGLCVTAGVGIPLPKCSTSYDFERKLQKEHNVLVTTSNGASQNQEPHRHVLLQ